MTLSRMMVPLLILPALISADDPTRSGTPDRPQHFTVLITHSGYDPATLTVEEGDIVRFVQRDLLAHNIVFRRVPDGAELAETYEPQATGGIEVLRAAPVTARDGPFLIGYGRVYEIRIGEGTPPGTYDFGCSRHRRWRGRMIVEAPGS